MTEDRDTVHTILSLSIYRLIEDVHFKISLLLGLLKVEAVP